MDGAQIRRANLARLSQFTGILGYFRGKTLPKSNDYNTTIAKIAAVKTYPLANP